MATSRQRSVLRKHRKAKARAKAKREVNLTIGDVKRARRREIAAKAAATKAAKAANKGSEKAASASLLLSQELSHE